MNQNIYTERYLNHLENVSAAQSEFDSNPCKHTATILSNLKALKFTDEVIYTEEYLLDRYNRIKESEKQHRNLLNNLFNTLQIELDYESGRISNELRNELHFRNDENNALFT